MSALSVLLYLAAVADAPPPNVVIVLADDLGYGDVQPLNESSAIPTPGFNRLASEGMTFTDAHTSAAVCTPTRYALLTGRHCWRTRLKSGVLGGYSDSLIAPDRQTIASLLSEAGYATDVIGKWHLGLTWQWNEQETEKDNFGRSKAIGKVDFSKPILGGPLSCGFDHCFLVAASLDMSPYVFVKDRRVTATPTEMIAASPFPAFYRKGEIADDFAIVDVLDRITEVASKTIRDRANEEKPFFLYVPLTAPHKPVLPHPRFVGRTSLGPYGDFIAQTDDVIGRLLTILDKENVAENTIFVVTSDNGSYMRSSKTATGHVEDASQQSFKPSSHRPNGPWRGTKADIYEAGHRVPFFVRWPGRVEAGSRSDAVVSQTDLLATIADAIDRPFDAESAEDSVSMLPVLQGGESARPPIVVQSAAGMLAIRDGNLKLIAGDGSGGRERPRGTLFGKPYQLYDLASDPGEANNLAEQRPEDVARLEAELLEIAHGDQKMP